MNLMRMKNKKVLKGERKRLKNNQRRGRGKGKDQQTIKLVNIK